MLEIIKLLKPGGVKVVTPKRMAEKTSCEKTVVSLDQYRWQSRCNGLYQLLVAA
jgi:hypothetical protein